MSEPIWLRREALEILHDDTIVTDGGSPGLRDEGLLDSALARPRNLHAYGEADICALAAAYAFGLVKNHAFIDGNKRAGFLACVVFLEMNGLRFCATEADAALKVLALAASDIDEAAFAAWLRETTERMS